MTHARIYLDWNATAPLHPAARAALAEALEAGGNPSSVHAEGRAARDRVETARAQVAALAGANRPKSSSPPAAPKPTRSPCAASPRRARC